MSAYYLSLYIGLAESFIKSLSVFPVGSVVVQLA